MDESILERLKKNSADGRLPMHMPGHKRNPQFEHLTPLGGTLDITEIDGFDDLNFPDGIFLESERLAASLWGSSECLYSVNGSSGAILAGVRAVIKNGGRLLMARGCHKSVYHAAELTGASAVYFEAELTSYGFLSGISPDEVEKKLSEYPDTKLVIITSPTYEGVISDVRSIADVCHRYNVPLMVDEAHGAHLGLHGIFPDGAVKCGADIVVQSIHKTLPSLTQTALLHLSGDLVSPLEVKRQMAMFQTSSPSYLLSSSIDGAVRFLASAEGERCLRQWHDAVLRTHERLRSLQNTGVFHAEDGAFDVDPSKFVLRGGAVLAELLRKNNVEPEMVSKYYTVAMTGAGDTATSLDAFASAVEAADRYNGSADVIVNTSRHHLPEVKTTIAEAVFLPRELCRGYDAIGRISAGYVYAYPPGIPLCVPGEIIDHRTVDEVMSLIDAGLDLRGLENGCFAVVK